MVIYDNECPYRDQVLINISNKHPNQSISWAIADACLSSCHLWLPNSHRSTLGMLQFYFCNGKGHWKRPESRSQGISILSSLLSYCSLEAVHVFLYCCLGYPSCLAYLNSIGWAAWVVLGTIKNTTSSTDPGLLSYGTLNTEHLHIHISYCVLYLALYRKAINSYSASHDNWCTMILWNRIMTAQCEGMGEVGSARYEPALLPPYPSITVLSYSNCQEIHSRQQTGLAV